MATLMSHAVRKYSALVVVCKRLEYLKGMVMANMTKQQHYAAWQKYADDCNRDSGYANGHAAGIDKTELQDAWAQDYPDDTCPAVQWDRASGKTIVVY